MTVDTDTLYWLPSEDYKYADVDYVYPRTSQLVRDVIDRAPITGRYRRVLIDVKVQDLHPGICSCIPGWHLDGSMKELEIHHLFTFNGPGTEFKDPSIRPDPITGITTFTSEDYHRGVYATEPCRRLLVRLTETNIIRPRNKPQPPSHGAIR